MTEEATVYQGLWPLGIAIIFCGSLAGAAGDTMVRMSYSAAGPEPSTKEMLKRPMFIIGMILTTAIDAACTLGALTFAPSRLSLALASGVFGGNTNVSAKVLTIAATQIFKGDVSLLRRFEAIYVIPTTNSCLVAEGIAPRPVEDPPESYRSWAPSSEAVAMPPR
ncbi:hypothetical protein, conserved [Eimeria maxima]|uniref:Uncharacterized protein n=1 Tax=Eimeria maxima TaxID=5804 RepID=U6MC54_EIMMA|nr:hypothetical protein, conserved [Eimeria maxima]CDJ60019.1 hypothetical protein, conserved [Eimeria maxima]